MLVSSRMKKLVSVGIIYTMDLCGVLNFLPALIGAVGGLASGLLANKGASDANSAQVALARENRQFERDTAYTMMKKRHQWEVEDLKAAGLNPILSAHGTPSMGNVGADTPPLQNEWAVGGPTMASSAQQIVGNLVALRQQKNNDLIAQQQAALHSAQAAHLQAQTEEQWQRVHENIVKKMGDQYVASASQLKASEDSLRADAQKTARETSNLEIQAGKIQADIDEVYSRISLLNEQKRTEVVDRQLKAEYANLARLEGEHRKVMTQKEEYSRDLEAIKVISESLGLPEKEFWKNIHEAGLHYEDALKWAHDGILEFISGKGYRNLDKHRKNR